VAENARVVEEVLLAGKGVQVGAADADAVHAHQRLAGSAHGFVGLVKSEAAGFV